MSFTLVSQNDALNTAVVNASYTEPSDNVGGSGLQQTEIFWNTNDGAWNQIAIPASNPAGGGAVSRDIPVALPTNPTSIKAYVRAVDISGNPGPQSLVKEVLITQDDTPPDPIPDW